MRIIRLLILGCCPSVPECAFTALRRGRGPLAPIAEPDDPRDKLPFCVYPPQEGHSDALLVFVGSDNSRWFDFGDDPRVSAQTRLRCGGASGACASAQRAASLDQVQACESLSCACEQDGSDVVFASHQKMISEVLPVCSGAGSRGFQMLLLGFGGGALPSHTISRCPHARVESVEIDPRVVEAATHFFGFVPSPGKNEVETNDAASAVQERVARGATASYAVILVDCFGSGGVVPKACRSRAFVDGLRRLLQPGGKAVHHVWAAQADGIRKTYEDAFGPAKVSMEPVMVSIAAVEQSYLVVARAPDEARPQSP